MDWPMTEVMYHRQTALQLLPSTHDLSRTSGSVVASVTRLELSVPSEQEAALHVPVQKMVSSTCKVNALVEEKTRGGVVSEGGFSRAESPPYDLRRRCFGFHDSRFPIPIATPTCYAHQQ
jgi:hypothetical protein